MPADGLDPLAPFRMDGKVAIVTGASSGLGARFARVLDAAGAKVVLVARRRERLEQLASELHDALPAPCDLARLDVGSVVEATLGRYGRVDVLVNNAGMVDVGSRRGRAARGLPRGRRRQPGRAVRARPARRPGDDRERRGGVIVNVASVLGLVGAGQIPQAGYAASKGGIVNLTRELSSQWAKKGIRVNALAPGWFESEMNEDMLSSEKGQQWVARRAPLGRHGREGELDGALLFLASDASTYVTGHVLAVDGGWTAI